MPMKPGEAVKTSLSYLQNHRSISPEEKRDISTVLKKFPKPGLIERKLQSAPEHVKSSVEILCTDFDNVDHARSVLDFMMGRQARKVVAGPGGTESEEFIAPKKTELAAGQEQFLRSVIPQLPMDQKPLDRGEIVKTHTIETVQHWETIDTRPSRVIRKENDERHEKRRAEEDEKKKEDEALPTPTLKEYKGILKNLRKAAEEHSATLDAHNAEAEYDFMKKENQWPTVIKFIDKHSAEMDALPAKDVEEAFKVHVLNDDKVLKDIKRFLEDGVEKDDLESFRSHTSSGIIDPIKEIVASINAKDTVKEVLKRLPEVKIPDYTQEKDYIDWFDRSPYLEERHERTKVLGLLHLLKTDPKAAEKRCMGFRWHGQGRENMENFLSALDHPGQQFKEKKKVFMDQEIELDHNAFKLAQSFGSSLFDKQNEKDLVFDEEKDKWRKPTDEEIQFAWKRILETSHKDVENDKKHLAKDKSSYTITKEHEWGPIETLWEMYQKDSEGFMKNVTRLTKKGLKKKAKHIMLDDYGVPMFDSELHSFYNNYINEFGGYPIKDYSKEGLSENENILYSFAKNIRDKDSKYYEDHDTHLSFRANLISYPENFKEAKDKLDAIEKSPVKDSMEFLKAALKKGAANDTGQVQNHAERVFSYLFPFYPKKITVGETKEDERFLMDVSTLGFGDMLRGRGRPNLDVFTNPLSRAHVIDIMNQRGGEGSDDELGGLVGETIVERQTEEHRLSEEKMRKYYEKQKERMKGSMFGGYGMGGLYDPGARYDRSDKEEGWIRLKSQLDGRGIKNVTLYGEGAELKEGVEFSPEAYTIGLSAFDTIQARFPKALKDYNYHSRENSEEAHILMQVLCNPETRKVFRESYQHGVIPTSRDGMDIEKTAEMARRVMIMQGYKWDKEHNVFEKVGEPIEDPRKMPDYEVDSLLKKTIKALEYRMGRRAEDTVLSHDEIAKWLAAKEREWNKPKKTSTLFGSITEEVKPEDRYTIPFEEAERRLRKKKTMEDHTKELGDELLIIQKDDKLHVNRAEAFIGTEDDIQSDAMEAIRPQINKFLHGIVLESEGEEFIPPIITQVGRLVNEEMVHRGYFPTRHYYKKMNFGRMAKQLIELSRGKDNQIEKFLGDKAKKQNEIEGALRAILPTLDADAANDVVELCYDAREDHRERDYEHYNKVRRVALLIGQQLGVVKEHVVAEDEHEIEPEEPEPKEAEEDYGFGGGLFGGRFDEDDDDS